jgi:hypothetical protein
MDKSQSARTTVPSVGPGTDNGRSLLQVKLNLEPIGRNYTKKKHLFAQMEILAMDFFIGQYNV